MNFSLNNMTRLTACAIAGLAMAAVPAHAATIFTTNTSGNAAGLEGDGAGDTTTLTLSTADGGGTIDLTSVSVYNGGTAQTLGMDTVGMGIGNSRWGNGPQGWIFTFDQTISFDGIGFNDAGGGGEGVFIQSDVWIGATVDDTGQNWTFDSVNGAFSVEGGNGPLFDFTSAGVADVTAGTEINIEHNSGNGGSNMTQFTITPTTVIPEPASLALLGIGSLLIAGRQRR